MGHRSPPLVNVVIDCPHILRPNMYRMYILYTFFTWNKISPSFSHFGLFINERVHGKLHYPEFHSATEPLIGGFTSGSAIWRQTCFSAFEIWFSGKNGVKQSFCDFFFFFKAFNHSASKMSFLKTDLDACNKSSVIFSRNSMEFKLIFIRYCRQILSNTVLFISCLKFHLFFF